MLLVLFCFIVLLCVGDSHPPEYSPDTLLAIWHSTTRAAVLNSHSEGNKIHQLNNQNSNCHISLIAAGWLIRACKQFEMQQKYYKTCLRAKLQTWNTEKKTSCLQMRRVIEIYYFHPWVGLRLHHRSACPVCCSQWQSVVSALVPSNSKHLTVRTTQSSPHPPMLLWLNH